MRKAMVFAAVVCLLSVSGASAFAQSSSTAFMGRRCISSWEMFKFIRDLKITDAQIEAFKSLKQETENKTDPIITQLKEQHAALADTLLAATIDTAAAESQIEALLVLETQISDIALHARLDASQVLTADQRVLIFGMVTKLRECDKARQGWLRMKKPAYFSQIMPDASLQ